MHPDHEPDAPPQPSSPQGADEPEQTAIPIIEEEVSISRAIEKTGALRVRIASHEEKQRIPVSEIVEEVSVERVPVNRYVRERTETREEGDVVVIPVFETVSVVEQRLLLKEEIRITRRRREVRREEEVVLRKEEPVIERRAADQDEWSQEPPER